MVKFQNPNFNRLSMIHPCDTQTGGQAISYSALSIMLSCAEKHQFAAILHHLHIIQESIAMTICTYLCQHDIINNTVVFICSPSGAWSFWVQRSLEVTESSSPVMCRYDGVDPHPSRAGCKMVSVNSFKEHKCNENRPIMCWIQSRITTGRKPWYEAAPVASMIMLNLQSTDTDLWNWHITNCQLNWCSRTTPPVHWW